MKRNFEKADKMIKDSGAILECLLVYKLIENNVVVYVGQTRDIKSRIRSHLSNKTFTSIETMPCNPDCVDELEASLIIKHMPIYNKSLPRNSGFVTVGSAKARLTRQILAIINSFEQIKISNYAGGYKYIPDELYDQLEAHVKNFKYELKAEVK